MVLEVPEVADGLEQCHLFVREVGMDKTDNNDLARPCASRKPISYPT